MRHLNANDQQKLADLSRIKMLATGVLIACFFLMVAAKLLEHVHPVFSIVAAFAEAATIGGIADWYAVVALFRHPAGIPFPHTAIIPANQPRIGDNLGRFIETNFLAPEPVAQRLEDIDFAAEMAAWLSDRGRSRRLAQFSIRFLPELLATVDEKRIIRFATDRVSAQLAQTDVAPLVGDVLGALTKDGRHQQLLDAVIRALHRFLSDEDTLRVVQAKIAEELPRLFYYFRTDALILERVMGVALDLLTEVEVDPDHPLRAEFELFIKEYVRRTRRSKAFAKQVEGLKQQLLARPEIAITADHIWTNLRGYILDDVARGDDSQLAARLSDLFTDVGESLAHAPGLRRDINAGMVAVVGNLVAAQRGNIALYVADQVKGWDMRQLLTLIEINVGRDLQYIRFNGMLIGGAVGVILYLLERLILG